MLAVAVIVLASASGSLAVWIARLSAQLRALQRQVERIAPTSAAGDPRPAPTVPPATPLEAKAAEQVGLSAEGELLVRQALQDGDRVEAVKFVRAETGMSLGEANRYVKTLERRQR